MSLAGVYDEQNIFAKILRGEAPAFKVFEDDVALAFLDIFPRSSGHTLVAPKYPARNLLDLPSTEVGRYMERVQTVAQAVTRALTPDGVMLVQFNGAPAGQTVFHLHMHIIPRYAQSPLLHEGESPRADMDALRALAARITAAV